MQLIFDHTRNPAAFARPAHRPPPARGAALKQQRADAIRHYVDRHLADPELCANRTARALGMSVRSLHMALEGTGESFCQLLQRRRLEMSCRLLCREDRAHSIADIAFACGFNSLSSFYRGFRRLWGACPNDLRRGAHPALQLAA